MRIHREGYPTLALTGAVLLLVNAAVFWGVSPGAAGVSLVVSLLAWGFFIQFFRNPPRSIPLDCPGGVLAPADGVIVAIEKTHEPEYFNDERLKLSIYMSALNVHVNRVPISGTVVYAKYHAGKYLVAYHPKSSELNERNTLVLEDADGRRVLVRQIAGILARRIVCYLVQGQTAHRGDELGFIKFGSRCDVFLPPNSTVKVALNQPVTGGESILAVLRDSDSQV